MIIAVSYFASSLNQGVCLFKPSLKKEYLNKGARAPVINEALELLKIRKDKEALVIFDKILIDQPDNLDASWGRAEVLRRTRNYREAQIILNEILKKNPQHAPSLISTAYIAYKDDELNQALQLINRALESGCADKNNKALAYVMLGTINSRRSAKGLLFNKIKYGTQIKSHFLRAKSLAPDLPEVHLSLGTFYLLAPAIFGRNLDKAREELELAVKIAPDFATACARLAQCYKKQGIYDKYNFYIERAKNLDPGNEIVRELKE